MPIRSLAEVYYLLLYLGGSYVIWRTMLRPAVRQNPTHAALAPWNITSLDFLLFLWIAFTSGFLCGYGSLFFLPATMSDEMKTMLATAASQLGSLAGMGLFHVYFDKQRAPSPPGTTGHTILSGIATFLAVIPAVAAVAWTWEKLLTTLHVSYDRQPVLEMLSNAGSPMFLVVTIVFACVGAPVVEELIFRAGIFRYTRTRWPRWIALLVTGIAFAAVHKNLASFAPLVALSIVFSLAYERTGNIKTTMIAHGLFNLNTILLVCAGVV